MKDRNGNELEYKDLLMISHGNYMHPGVFVRPGVSNNLNYYFVGDYRLNALLSKSKKVDYLASASNNSGRYIKISRDNLKDSEKIIYDEIIKLM